MSRARSDFQSVLLGECVNAPPPVLIGRAHGPINRLVGSSLLFKPSPFIVQLLLFSPTAGVCCDDHFSFSFFRDLFSSQGSEEYFFGETGPRKHLYNVPTRALTSASDTGSCWRWMFCVVSEKACLNAASQKQVTFAKEPPPRPLLLLRPISQASLAYKSL